MAAASAAATRLRMVSSELRVRLHSTVILLNARAAASAADGTWPGRKGKGNGKTLSGGLVREAKAAMDTSLSTERGHVIP